MKAEDQVEFMGFFVLFFVLCLLTRTVACVSSLLPPSGKLQTDSPCCAFLVHLAILLCNGNVLIRNSIDDTSM